MKQWCGHICIVVAIAALNAACSSSGGSASSNPLAPTAGNSATPASSPSSLDSDLTFCVTETNRYRATLGLSELVRSSALETYAATGAQEDGLAHVAHQHFTSTHGGGIALAENEMT